MEARNGRPEVVVVTGASSGVARATVREFAKHGAHVGLLARNEGALNAAKEEAESLGGRALVVPTDVTDPEQVEDAAEKVEEEFGPIDIWVNVAMTVVFAPLKDITPEEFKRATEVNYLGFVYGTMSALKHMLPRDRGTIVQVGSALAYRGIPLQSTYCGSKFAIRGMTDSLRTELKHDGSNVHVTMPQLPGLNTPQFDHCRIKTLGHYPQPVPPIYQPEVAAEGIYYAAHHKRREVYVGASTVFTILGNKVAPWFADWYLGRTGYSSQQTQKTLQGSYQPGNLFETVAKDPGAHGRFDEEAHEKSPQLWANKRRGTLLAAAGVGLAGLTAAALRK